MIVEDVEADGRRALSSLGVAVLVERLERACRRARRSARGRRSPSRWRPGRPGRSRDRRRREGEASWLRVVDTRPMIPSHAVRRQRDSARRCVASPLVLRPSPSCGAACSGAGKAGADAGGGDEVARAQALATESAVLPPRPEVDRARPVRRGARAARRARARAPSSCMPSPRTSTSASGGSSIASRTRRRPSTSIASAGRDLALPGACDAAARGAKLAGELAKDAHTTYAELYRVQRRSTAADGGAGGSAGARVDEPLAALAAFRPAPQVLDAIDQGLAGEGAIALAVAGCRRARASSRRRASRASSSGPAPRARASSSTSIARRASASATSPSAGGRGARTYVDLDGVELGGAPRETRARRHRLAHRRRVDDDRLARRARSRTARRTGASSTCSSRIASSSTSRGSRRAPGRRATAARVARVVLDPGHGGNDPGAQRADGPQGEGRHARHRAQGRARARAVRASRSRSRATTIATSRSRSAPRARTRSAPTSSSRSTATRRRTRRARASRPTSSTRRRTRWRARSPRARTATSQAASNEVAQLLASMRLADQATRSTRLAELMQRAGIASLERPVRRRHRRRRPPRGLLRARRRAHARGALRDELHLERDRGAAPRLGRLPAAPGRRDRERDQGVPRRPLSARERRA